MKDRLYFQNQDLVLKVSKNYDPKKVNIEKYYPFLDAIHGNREYNKEAVIETIRYFLGGEYKNLRDLATENYHQNPKLQEKFQSLDDFLTNLQLPEKLSCSLDLATGVGKSYIIYSISRIMLAEGAVDQVLVLCPSNTIEEGLTSKFKALSADRDLKELLPGGSKILNPRIINASQTIKKGDICIENIHATYARTRSAIEDSLVGKGDRTLVLNDEAHHMANPSDKALKKWKEFLIDYKYGFKYIVNLSGTCYIDNEYFVDVIYRYSLRQAMEEKFVKLVKYIVEDAKGNEYEKFQKMYDNHIENKTTKARKVKPISILVTKDIKKCKLVADKLIEFIAKKEKAKKDKVREKVLVVTSSAEHEDNIPILREVDDKTNPVEWICSVSMLSEGWDVKNVFQVIPHEDRAFNSKLLIAQVLGRGLRIPDVYKGEQPEVKVFNHDKWSQSIAHLVDEILEIEKKLYSYPMKKRNDYNFDIENISYRKEEKLIKTPQTDEYDLFTKDYVAFEAQSEEVERRTEYREALKGGQETKFTKVELQMYPVEEVATQMLSRLAAYDLDAGTTYHKKYTLEKIEEVLRNSLRKINFNKDIMSHQNRQRALQAIGTIKRDAAYSLRYDIEVKDIVILNTKDIKRVPLSIGNLKRGHTIFFDTDAIANSEKEDKQLIMELLKDEERSLSALIEVTNSYCFKTPVNFIFTSQEPERLFVKYLFDQRNTNSIDACIKSPDTGFYEIEYFWRKGEHFKRGIFNPDFFIKIGTNFLIVEIKADTDVSEDNKAKMNYAREHFSRLNSIQNKHKYHFNMLSKESYDQFFKFMREGNYDKFKSTLEAKLEAL